MVCNGLHVAGEVPSGRGSHVRQILGSTGAWCRLNPVIASMLLQLMSDERRGQSGVLSGRRGLRHSADREIWRRFDRFARLIHTGGKFS